MFNGRDMRQPKFCEITATLTQDSDPPATVRIYKPQTSAAMPGVGTLFFVVLSKAAALAAWKSSSNSSIPSKQ
jgi:hypothetical protein